MAWLGDSSTLPLHESFVPARPRCEKSVPGPLRALYYSVFLRPLADKMPRCLPPAQQIAGILSGPDLNANLGWRRATGMSRMHCGDRIGSRLDYPKKGHCGPKPRLFQAWGGPKQDLECVVCSAC